MLRDQSPLAEKVHAGVKGSHYLDSKNLPVRTKMNTSHNYNAL